VSEKQHDTGKVNIWRWLGWDTREARTERVKDTNWHSTIQWAIFMGGLVVIAAFIWL
jgi:hypothetical protein